MTVKELKEKLNKFPDSCRVFIDNPDGYRSLPPYQPYVEITHVSRGVNEMDMMVILDDYTEEDDNEIQN